MFRMMCKFFSVGLPATISRSRFRVFLCTACLFALRLATPVTGETVTYPIPDGTLQSVDGHLNCLAPFNSNSGKSDSLSGNSVTVLSSGNVPGSVYGAINISGDRDVVSNNQVFIYGTTSHVHGGRANVATVTGNSVEISGAAAVVQGEVSGGMSHDGIATLNSVGISGGTVNYHVYGGRTYSGNATRNSVDISGGTVGTAGWGIYGGYVGSSTDAGIAEENNVTISGATTVVKSDVHGGSSSGGAALHNTVTINGGTMERSVSGGWSNFGNVAGNSVVVNGGTVNGNVHGGYVNGAGNAAGNNVTINDGAVLDTVFGGHSISGIATGNSVTMNGGTVQRVISGGFSDRGNVLGNRITINGGTVYQVNGGWSNSGNVTNNIAEISGGMVQHSVTGGSNHDSFGAGNVTGNTVIISGGTIGDGIAFGSGNVYGGWSYSGDAADNNVVISGGTVRRDIIGGFSDTKDATGNTVTISNNGTLNLANSFLYGGWTSGTGNVFSGNTFHLHSADVQVAGLRNFEYLNFYLPATLGNGGVMLTATNDAWIDNTIVNVGIAGGSSPLAIGDHVVLIQTGALIGTPRNVMADGRGLQGQAGGLLRYEFDIEVQRSLNELWAVLRKIDLNPQAEDLSKGFLAGMSLLNQGGDLVSGHGMSGAVRAAREAHLRGNGIFFDMSGGWSRYNTGCHVDMSNLSLITGVSKYKQLRGGSLTWGAFFEHGNGSYDTYNSFVDADPVHGNGNLRHFGGGVLGRLEYHNTGSGHSYTEGSFRAGGLSNGYYNADISDFSGRAVSYDSTSAYFGSHIGIGKIRYLSNRAIIDLNTKYLWSHLQGDTVTLSTDETVDFRSIGSHRLRMGGRYTGTAYRTANPYIGAAWEHEFRGNARASTGGFAVDVPTLRGSTAIFELGFAWKPTAKASARGLYVDMGVQGYLGKREGMTANLLVGRMF